MATEWGVHLLAATSMSTRVFGGCLCAGLLCSLAVRQNDRTRRKLPVPLDRVLRVLAWMFIIAAAAVLFLEPFG